MMISQFRQKIASAGYQSNSVEKSFALFPSLKMFRKEIEPFLGTGNFLTSSAHSDQISAFKLLDEMFVLLFTAFPFGTARNDQKVSSIQGGHGQFPSHSFPCFSYVFIVLFMLHFNCRKRSTKWHYTEAGMNQVKWRLW